MGTVFSLKAIAVVLGFGLLLAGCGQEEREALTREEFNLRAESICSKVLWRRERPLVVAQAPATPPAKEARLVRKELLPPVRYGTAELADLVPPEEDRQKVEKIITSFEAGIAKAEEDPFTLVTGVAFAEAEHLSQEYGLAACSQI